MPTFRYSLEAGGPKRLAISMPVFRGPTTVMLDDQTIATIPAGALHKGHTCELPDGSRLEVAYKSRIGQADWRIAYNGKPLPGTADDPETRVRAAASVLFFIAGATALLGIAALLWPGQPVLEALGGAASLFIAPVYGLLGWFTRRGSFIACALGGLIVLADTVYMPVALALGPESMRAGGSTGGVVMRVFFLTMLYRGATTLWKRRKERRAALAGAAG